MFSLFFFVYLKGDINSTERMYNVEIIVCPCMAFSVYEVVRVAYQSRSWFVIYAPTTRQTASHANDFVNAKSYAREKALLAG